METRTTTLQLPFPPSLNNVFRNAGKRRIDTERYAAWKTEAAWSIRAQRPRTVSGRVSVTIEADDLTVLREVTTRWLDAGEPCTITVRSLP